MLIKHNRHISLKLNTQSQQKLETKPNLQQNAIDILASKRLETNPNLQQNTIDILASKETESKDVDDKEVVGPVENVEDQEYDRKQVPG